MSRTQWGERAAELYQSDYAARYRQADDEIRDTAAMQDFARWLRRLTESFGREIAALDLGCGTGRYFWALRNVRELVGVDASAAMLDLARTPVNAADITIRHITLIQGDFLAHVFDAGRFDLVYSIGVLAEHSPLNDRVVSHVSSWLAPGGLFAFTAVDPQSFSVNRTWKRRLAEWAVTVTGGAIRSALRSRLLSGGMYADEARVRELLAKHGLEVESVEPHLSDIHLHLMCVARKPY